ncbi:MAG: MoaD/ThiS family protein, partial [Candidatus Nitrosotenuis sp.]
MKLDKKNILIAVNGADSSSLNGIDTILRSGDVVNIIPVIHGGARIKLELESQNIELFNVKGKKGKNHDNLIEIRALFPNIVMQGLSSKNIASILHVRKVL